MLAVLAEINCLSTLNKYNIYPDEFYTDFELFKNHAVNFRNTTIVIIFAGTCNFNKRLAVDFIKTLMKRENNDTDKGVNNVYVISDSTLGTLDRYYKYIGNLDKIDLCSRFNVLKEDVDLLIQLEGVKKESILYLSDYDNSESTCSKDAYLNRGNSEDELVRLIKKPDVKKMVQLS